MNVLERTQYHASLAVSGTWNGKNRETNYEELGWDTFNLKTYFRINQHKIVVVVVKQVILK